ncbi:MAG: acetyl-CoA carboxylase biotin carboxyl carrier protein [Balneolaceae bacterium]
MDLKLVKKLINLISESDVDEVSIEEGDFKISVKKRSEELAQTVQHYQLPPQPVSQQSPQPAPPASEASSEADSQPAEGTTEIRSPIVGTFYASPSPEDGPFVKPGDRIEKGATICIIEAMKIMNEIESEHSGIVEKVLVENGQPVEFDQPLFIIKQG